MRSTNTSGLIAFDLEGPLSPQDNAYEVMGLTERGYEVFERLSRYDDILTIEGRPGYEPGDTLYLILPFLIAEGIHEDHIRSVSQKAHLTPGAKETVDTFISEGYRVVIISTSYEPHAYYIGERLGIPSEFIACTPFPFKKDLNLSEDERRKITGLKKRLLEVSPEEDEILKKVLDEFYLRELPSMSLYRYISGIKVMGGRRKVDALRSFMAKFNLPEASTVCIGDSITDFRMLDYINRSGGLAIVFNGNEYSVPYATIGIAGETLLGVVEPVRAFFKKGIAGVKEFVLSSPRHQLIYTFLQDCEDLEPVIAGHKLMRRRIRGRAAQLG